MSKEYYGSQVKVAFLHQTVQIPGVFGGEKTLSAARVPGIKMTYLPEGLLVEAKGTKGIVPLANIAICVFENDEAEVKETKTKTKVSTQMV